MTGQGVFGLKRHGGHCSCPSEINNIKGRCETIQQTRGIRSDRTANYPLWSHKIIEEEKNLATKIIEDLPGLVTVC